MHIGHAYCTTIADTIARYKRLQGIETFFLTTNLKYAYLSSSIVKEVAKYNGDLAALVPEELVAKIKLGLEKKGGYCPCRLEKSEDTKCMCKAFREQIADPDFEGFCHCMLYYKTKD